MKNIVSTTDSDQQYLDKIENITYKPIFIMGLQRSGTSILYKILNVSFIVVHNDFPPLPTVASSFVLSFSEARLSHVRTVEGFFPKQIQGTEMMRQKIEYIHHNPVRKGLVETPEQWGYSSALNYLGLEGDLEVCKDW